MIMKNDKKIYINKITNMFGEDKNRVEVFFFDRIGHSTERYGQERVSTHMCIKVPPIGCKIESKTHSDYELRTKQMYL